MARNKTQKADVIWSDPPFHQAATAQHALDTASARRARRAQTRLVLRSLEQLKPGGRLVIIKSK